MNCFKVYFCGAYISARNSEAQAIQFMRQITNAMKRHIKGQYFAGYEQGKSEAAAQPVADLPKSEAVAELCLRLAERKINEALEADHGTSLVFDIRSEDFAAILRPYFTQVSQPPTNETKKE